MRQRSVAEADIILKAICLVRELYGVAVAVGVGGIDKLVKVVHPAVGAIKLDGHIIVVLKCAPYLKGKCALFVIEDTDKLDGVIAAVPELEVDGASAAFGDRDRCVGAHLHVVHGEVVALALDSFKEGEERRGVQSA